MLNKKIKTYVRFKNKIKMSKEQIAEKEMSKFYDWILKLKSVYLADNKRMCTAYEKVYTNALTN